MNTSLNHLPRRDHGRLTELDWLRVIAFGLLILYHVGMYYVSWDWHVKSPRLVPGLEAAMLWLNPWRMSLLFLISGAAIGLMVERGSQGLIRQRSARLLLPLLFGMAVVVPPQSYLQVVEKFGYAGSYLDFLQLYAHAYHGFCSDSADGRTCLTLPTWNHLWFLPYLWCYTMLALLLCKAGPWTRHAGWSGLVSGTRVLWVPWLVLALLRQHLMPLFPIRNDLVHDWYHHALSLSMFVVGMALFGHRDDRHGAWAAVHRWRWVALVLAVVVQISFQCWSDSYGDNEDVSTASLMALRVLSSGRQWLPLVAVLGWGRHWLAQRDSLTLRWLTQAVFPFYIVHQTATVVSAHWLAQQQWPLALEAAAVVAFTVVVCGAAAWLAMQVSWLRPWMGLAPKGPEALKTLKALNDSDALNESKALNQSKT
ncbi:Acyltransferase family protein [Roseateles sp. YR242]|uniref:acyltransferase family protein n=1 Tax=Roseateles sp. YR242 TaxID=1855305 RepID=UPI0008D7AC56|nr:acyltransferase [Roseateles sp. YR242]SEL01198.1 Acyltransferase family protein [Roseateles sp. YR242]